MKIAIFLIIFLLLGAFYIISENNLILSNNENLEEFSERYEGWIAKLIDNSIGITGRAVDMDWLPQE